MDPNYSKPIIIVNGDAAVIPDSGQSLVYANSVGLLSTRNSGGTVTNFIALGPTSEITSTPAGITQTITIASGIHQTLDLSSSSGDVTLTLTVPAVVSAGTIIIKQHGTASRNITWVVSAGAIIWLGTQPVWSGDAVSTYRVVSWRFNGTNMFLATTEVGI